jgi:hypothetical protein
MTSHESRHLEPGQRISWVGSQEYVGTVLSTDFLGVDIKWDFGRRERRWHPEMDDIEKV